MEFPAALVSIGDQAFEGCTALRTAVIPGNLHTLGTQAFAGCTAFETVRFRGYLAELPAECFAGDTALRSAVLPASLAAIGERAFDGCTALTEVYIPQTVTSIGDGAFPQSTVLTGAENSYAQTYAQSSGLAFRAAEAPSVPEQPVEPAVQGSLAIDTEWHRMAPGDLYDIAVSVSGMDGRKLRVYSSRDGIAQVTPLGNGRYRVAGRAAGTAYIMFEVYEGDTQITHASVRIEVAPGADRAGERGNNVSYFG